MMTLTLNEIAAACDGKYVGDESFKSVAVSSVERDSREVKKNSLFLAIKGERTDGHKYIQKCYDSGAVCAVCEKPPENPSKPYILVDSTLEAVKKIAEAYRLKFNIPIIGVSGSVGKTSTKEMLYAVLSQKYKTHKTQGNLNNELGVPLTLLSMPKDAQAAVIEMGISDFGEMTRLSRMVKPTVCVLTVIGFCHLEKLGDRDGVLKAKTEMFKYAADNAEFILNGDDDKLSAITDINGKKPIFFGLSPKNDVYAEDIENNVGDGITCAICGGGSRVRVKIPAIGSYTVQNALAAAAVGKLLGLSDSRIAEGISAYKTVGSRANLITTKDLKIIDDCYNANPTSVKASIDTLMSFGGRRVAVLGDMKELGAKELELHREIGKYAKSRGVDLIIAVGPLAKALAESADGLWFESASAALPRLGELLKKGDTVLVKASHSMNFEIITESLKKLKF